MTNFSIPNTGYKVGTCGWLAAGLAAGTITIYPATSKSGKGGLWLKTPVGSECLAIFNEYDLTEEQMCNARRFGVVSMGFCDSLPLTAAASRYLHEVAKQWSDAANEFRENDAPETMPTVVIG